MKRLFSLCGRYRRSICILAGGALPEAEQDKVNSHLASCADCKKYYEEIQAVAIPLTNWEKGFTRFQPGQAVKNRWARSVHTAGRPALDRRLAPVMLFGEWWREVIQPRGRVWAGLAAVWVVIFLGNFCLHDQSQATAVKSSPSSQEMIASFRDQQKILAELLTDHSLPHSAARQKFVAPGPRTEKHERIDRVILI